MRVGIAAATHRTSIGLASARFLGAADYGHVSRCSLRDFRSEGVIAITAADPVENQVYEQADCLTIALSSSTVAAGRLPFALQDQPTR